MAVRFSGSGQNYSSTAGVPTTRLFTVTLWVYPITLRSPSSIVWSLDSSSSQYCVFGYTSAGDTSMEWTAPGGTRFATSVNISSSLNTWWRFALTVNGNTANMFYAPATSTGLTMTTGNGNFVLPSGTLTLYWGGTPSFSTQWPDARVAAFKMWDAELTQEEIEQELASYKPQRSANLNRWHPFISADTTDFSGRGRTLSGGSGATTESGPPIAWSRLKVTTLPWDPNTVVWYAHYDTTSGELLSLGTVLPSPLPAGTAALALLQQPDLTAVIWDPISRSFVDRAGEQIFDRAYDDLANDASLTSAWSALNSTQADAMKSRVATMLGSHRYRYASAPVDLD